MPANQSAASHTAMDSLTHFTLMPIYLLTLILAVIVAEHAVVHHEGTVQVLLSLWLVVLAISFILLNAKTRLYSLRLQDRIIRLEERVRLAALLPVGQAEDAATRLSTGQLIALRFASDAELPALVTRTLAEGLTGKQIKQAIVQWRPDLARV